MKMISDGYQYLYRLMLKVLLPVLEMKMWYHAVSVYIAPF